MKKLVFIILAIFFVGLLFFVNKENNSIEKKIKVEKKNETQEKQYVVKNPSLFVPYWTLNENAVEGDYPHILYFGLGVDRNGINKNEEGYKNLGLFESNKQKGISSSLVIRMIDSDLNFKILEDKKARAAIISESLILAKQYGFYGIVLDLEVSSLPFDSIVSEINSFVSDFSDESHSKNLSFSLTLFGDTFSRIRPYDVPFLGKKADSVYIMAYDFHKANRTPGPNFPFVGKETYGYDFKTMVSDFLHTVPKEKINVVFGMFGYDWTLNEDGETVGVAQPLSYFEIQKKFFPDCPFNSCVISKNPESLETQITYVDVAGEKHVVWFEDMDSVNKKMEFLKTKGISSFGYWAYSFF